MKILVRVLISLLLLMMVLSLASCTGAPGCPQAGFGSSSGCTPGNGGGSFGGGGGSGGGGGGGSNATPAAFAFAVDQIGGANGTGANGTIDAYDLSTSAGTFQALNGFNAPIIPAGDPGDSMVVVNKQFIYTIFENGSDDGIYGWSINSSTGALTTLTGFPLLMGLSLNAGASFNQYSITSDPAGKFLFIANTNLAEILAYSINSTTGALTAVPGSPFATPTDAVNLTTDGLGRFLYACEGDIPGHSGGEVFAFAIGSNGALTTIPGSPFVVPMWQLQGEASGKFLVGTTGNSAFFSSQDVDLLYVFSIDQTSGAISQVGTPVTTVFSPFTIAMQPPSSNGEFVYSFSINDTATGYNNIEGYSLNTTTGALTAISGSPFGGSITPGIWGQFDQSGANLVVYSNLISGSGTLTNLIPLSVNSDGTLTAPISPVQLVTPGYWVVTDP